MGKVDEIRALGRSQIGRMLERAGALKPAKAAKPVTKSVPELRNVVANIGTQKVANKGTQPKRRGRPKSALSKKERQQAYRDRLKEESITSPHGDA